MAVSDAMTPKIIKMIEAEEQLKEEQPKHAEEMDEKTKPKTGRIKRRR